MTLRLSPEFHPLGTAIAAPRYYLCAAESAHREICYSELVQNGNCRAQLSILLCPQSCGLADVSPTPRPCTSRDQGSPLRPTERRSRPIRDATNLPDGQLSKTCQPPRAMIFRFIGNAAQWFPAFAGTTTVGLARSPYSQGRQPISHAHHLSKKPRTMPGLFTSSISVSAAQ